MPKTWIQFSLIALALFVIFAGPAAVIRAWSEYQIGRENYRQHQERTEIHEKQTVQAALEECDVPSFFFFPAGLIGVSKCLEDKMASHRREYTTSKDLEAQQDMAYWAKWGGLVAAVNIVVSTVGLAALLYTLQLNQAANRAAQDAVDVTMKIGNADIRPWVVVQLGVARDIIPTAGGTKIRLRLTLSNVGKSAATQIVTAFHYMPHHSTDESKMVLEKYRAARLKTRQDGTSVSERRYSIAPGQSITREIDQVGIVCEQGKAFYPLFMVSVIYRGNGIPIDGSSESGIFADNHASFLLREADEQGALTTCIWDGEKISRTDVAFELLTDGTIT